MAMNLPGLPFPASELGWDKVDEVMKFTKLSRKESCTVIALVCGQPSADTTYESNMFTSFLVGFIVFGANKIFWFVA